MLTRHVGPEDILAGAGRQLAAGLDTAGVVAILAACEDAGRSTEPTISIICLEPDLAGTGRDD